MSEYEDSCPFDMYEKELSALQSTNKQLEEKLKQAEAENERLKAKLNTAVEYMEEMHEKENWDDAYQVLVKALSKIKGDD